ncbi:PREDICTED: uncharacterized protein LOC105596699 isoform X2 [Cercocebus atys]|uniref:uncharacterized protein LOC105596699 isoform X2 n=1 Tax=Cercocebus atys TaxID=9531 RepID=UPI0005F3A7C7|nr:PREDICTED: uncharacterized protein LOC105596699 isoform X2 [Cercocebus atys]
MFVEKVWQVSPFPPLLLVLLVLFILQQHSRQPLSTGSPCIRFPVPPTSPGWCLHLLPSILQCRLLWAWPQGYGQTPLPSQRPLVIVPWHVGRGLPGSAEELLMDAAEEAPMGPTTLDPSLLPGGPLVSFVVWAEAITWIPTWEWTSDVGPQPPSSSKSLHSHGDALHLFPRDRLDPETLDPGPPLE